ncbi:MAG: hypothetical protein PVSMB7_22580 [Chloroflexota bacterium]
MREFLTWMQQSAVGNFMRESSLWMYPIVNLLHIFGIASLFGSILIIDLRLVGVWRRVPLAPLTDAAVPIARLGFAIAATTGIGLLATKATEYYGNPFLLIKFPAIALGLLNALALNLSPAWRARGHRELSDSENRQLAIMGGISLACWMTAVTAGRLIAYW